MNDFLLPLISVVIPTYNHAHFLERALTSIVGQSYSNWEIIVVDNHSNDNTDEVLEKFDSTKLNIRKIHNNGIIAVSRNEGIQYAKGEWIAFLDSDDWWSSSKLEKMVEAINSETDFIFHDLKIERETSSFLGWKKIQGRHLKQPITVDLLVKGNAIATSSVIVRKEIIDKVGGFNEATEMIASEDYNTWLRISEISNGFKYINKSLGYYRLGDDSASRKDMSINTRYACASYMELLNRKQTKKVESGFQYSKGRYEFKLGNYENAKKNLFFTMKYAPFILKIKSFVMLVKIFMSTNKLKIAR